MHMQTTANSLPREILDQCESLQSTAEYIRVLASVVESQIDKVRGFMRDPDFAGYSLADIGEWREMNTILSLLKSQAEIVLDTSSALEGARQVAA